MDGDLRNSHYLQTLIKRYPSLQLIVKVLPEVLLGASLKLGRKSEGDKQIELQRMITKI